MANHAGDREQKGSDGIRDFKASETVAARKAGREISLGEAAQGRLDLNTRASDYDTKGDLVYIEEVYAVNVRPTRET